MRAPPSGKPQQHHYDVCIVGAGPAGLAALSAIQEPYTLDTLSDYQVHQANNHLDHRQQQRQPSSSVSGSGAGTIRRVCVIDPHPTWLDEWDRNFATLDIQYLRSPALAHPDHFDKNALLAFAFAGGKGGNGGNGGNGKGGRDVADLMESGCADNRKLLALGESQVGLWKLPSAALFRAFCRAMARRLPHDYVRGHVIDVTKADGDGEVDGGANRRRPFTLTVMQSGGGRGRQDGESRDGDEQRVTVTATSVVLALGTAGRPVVPPTLKGMRPGSIFPWTRLRTDLSPAHSSVLVVGGGLTAVQVAQYALRRGRRVVLCSRRPLVERHFDISEDWFDRRTSQRRLSSFYHESEDDRLRRLREARGGGSVPPVYLRDLDGWERRGAFRRVAGVEATFDGHADDGRAIVRFAGKHGPTGKDDAGVFDCVILACGREVDCTANPLVGRIQQRWPIRIVGGYPSVSEDLEWTPAGGMYVVGGLSSLNTGPDAANLMGMRRAAGVVANALDCRCWLREAESKVLSNRYQAFWDDDDSTVASSTKDSDEDASE